MFRERKGERPQSVDWVLTRHQYAMAPYGEWFEYARRVERFWKGEFAVPTDVEDQIEVVKPSRAGNILNKYMSMLAIRSSRRIQVAMLERTKQEYARVEKIERCLRAFVEGMSVSGSMHPWRAAAWWGLMRGRGGLITRYLPDRNGGRIQVISPDPLEYFPVYDDEGVMYYTREYYKTRYELETFFNSIEGGGEYSVPNINLAQYIGTGDEPSPHDIIRVVEYWDPEWHAAVIGGTQLYGPIRCGYGVATVAESRFNETPLSEQRWASIGLIGHVLEDLRAYNIMLAKQATGMEQFYYPRMYYIAQDGQIMEYSGQTEPGQFVPIMPGTQPIILSPSPNHDALMSFRNEIEQNITQGTLPVIVYTNDIPRVSGFLVSQILSLVQDAIADKRDALERMYSENLSHVLMLMERFGKNRKEGGWELNVTIGRRSGRRAVEVLTPDDIAGHYHVRVSVIASLPSDKVQQVTIMNQIRRRDPATGEPEMPWEAALIYSGMADEIEDLEEVRKERELEWAVMVDEELRSLRLAAIKQENERRIREWRKMAERYQRRVEGDKQEDVLVIEKSKLTPQVLHAMASIMEQGGDPESVLRMGPQTAQQAVGGVQPQQPQQPQMMVPEQLSTLSAQIQPTEGDLVELMQALGLAQEGIGEAPPFGGFEQGIAPSVQPPELRGRIPREGMDTSLEQERLEEYIRRGALPPPK